MHSHRFSACRSEADSAEAPTLNSLPHTWGWLQVANVALGVPVRVFRKFEEHAGSEYDAHYVYDGLYLVVSYATQLPAATLCCLFQICQ